MVWHDILSLFFAPEEALAFILLSVLRQVHSLFQTEFFAECDLVLPLSILGVLSFPYGHPVAGYVFILVFPSFLSVSYISFNNVF